jgi:ATP-binding cassette subfamily B protein
MLPIVLDHKAIVLSGLGCALVTLLLQLAIPRVVRLTFDRAIVPELAPHLSGGREPAPLSLFITILVVVAVVRFVIGYVYRYNLQRTAFVIEYDLRNLLYEKFQRLPFSYFDRMQSGQLISRANSDIRSVQMFLAFAPTVVISLVTFVVAFVLMATTHLGLALAAVLPLPFVYVTGALMRNRMFPISWIVSSRQADVATIVEENVTGTRVVKSFAQEEAQLRLLARAAQRLRWAGVLQVDVRANYSPFLQNLPRLGLAVVLLYGGKLVLDGAVTIGTVIEFNAYVVMLQMPFMMLGFLMMMGQRAAASAGRIFEIVDEPETVVDRPGAVPLGPTSGDGPFVAARGEVLFDDVTFAYPTAGDDAPNVLDGLTLHLAAGETVALVGRTGSGKSTLARLLPRFYDVTGGAVRVDGHDVRDLTLESLRATIGLVLDEPFLFSESIRENIAYGRPSASDEEVEAAARAAGVLEFVDRLPDGFETVIGERGYTLSGGQRQRIAIARTLLVNPRILVLDDATSAIDVHVEHEIHGALRTLMEGRTTLIIAHRLSTISLADRVVLLKDGRIVADGTHAELMANVPDYAEVLAHAEEEWQAAHAHHGDGGEDSPSPSAFGRARVSDAAAIAPKADLPGGFGLGAAGGGS